ncbi:biotin transporter BioY [Stappia indica]|uniref:biotin transporter BioY n=1 Tax=Stappia indica TaxID=538381 RepID=UPI000A98E98D
MMTADRSLVHIAIHVAVISALGYYLPAFTTPITGSVPITAQTLGVMLAGVMLGPVRGALAVLLFLLIVALGMPVLSGGRGGIGVFFLPSVGFLIGFPIAAFVCGLTMQLLRRRPVFPSVLVASMVGGILALYPFGILGISLVAGKPLWEAAIGSLVFLPGDILKCFGTALVASAIERGRPDAIFSRQ